MATSKQVAKQQRSTPKGNPVTTPETIGEGAPPLNEGTGEQVDQTTQQGAEESSAQAPGEGAATIVGDASAPVGTPVQAVVQAAESFTAAVATANTDAQLRELNLLGYESEFQTRLLGFLSAESELTGQTKHFIQVVLDYAFKMGPTAPLDEVNGGRAQVTFITEVLSYLNAVPSDLRVGFNIGLAIVNESILNGTGFSGVLPFRWLESVSASPERRKALVNLMHLLISTADSKVRSQAVRQIDMAKVLSYGLTDGARDAVTQFYLT